MVEHTCSDCIEGAPKIQNRIVLENILYCELLKKDVNKNNESCIQFSFIDI